MSTASPISHLPHTAHPIPLREQAFTLHCQGLRSPAIAAELGVSERTIRAWIAAALADLKDDLQLSRKEQLLLAVERQHQLTAIAWQQFHQETAARDALLDAALDTLLSAANNPSESASVSTRPFHLHLPAGTPAPRYLSLILQANKEANRLLGLHTLARLHLLTPDVPNIPETDPVPFTDSDIPAESATASGSPLLVGEGLGVRSHMPAESATAAPTGLAAGLQPANPHPPLASPPANPPHPILPESATTPAADSENAAATATASDLSASSPSTSASSTLNLRIPAESATASSSPLRARRGVGDEVPYAIAGERERAAS